MEPAHRPGGCLCVRRHQGLRENDWPGEDQRNGIDRRGPLLVLQRPIPRNRPPDSAVRHLLTDHQGPSATAVEGLPGFSRQGKEHLWKRPPPEPRNPPRKPPQAWRPHLLSVLPIVSPSTKKSTSSSALSSSPRSARWRRRSLISANPVRRIVNSTAPCVTTCSTSSTANVVNS